jgi:hypothetical protein
MGRFSDTLVSPSCFTSRLPRPAIVRCDILWSERWTHSEINKEAMGRSQCLFLRFWSFVSMRSACGLRRKCVWSCVSFSAGKKTLRGRHDQRAVHTCRLAARPESSKGLAPMGLLQGISAYAWVYLCKSWPETSPAIRDGTRFLEMDISLIHENLQNISDKNSVHSVSREAENVWNSESGLTAVPLRWVTRPNWLGVFVLTPSSVLTSVRNAIYSAARSERIRNDRKSWQLEEERETQARLG